MKFFEVLIFLLFLLVSTEGANILFMHSYASYSHKISMLPLANALQARGHNITYIAPMPAVKPNPKIHDIIPKSFKAFVDMSINKEFNINNRVENKSPNLFEIFDKVSIMACEALLSSEEFQEWIKKSPQIDLVIADLIPDCGVGIAYKLNAKMILYNTVPFYGKMVDMFQIPHESLASYCDLAYKSPMTFGQRIKNTLLPLAWLYNEYGTQSSLGKILKKGLNIKELPPIYDLYQNVSLVMLTGNYISEQPRSLPPMFVSVPGLHVKSINEPLAPELEKFINSTDSGRNESDGFVYISLGTLVIASHLPQHIQDVFMNSIRAFPRIQFFWRWSGEFPKNIPKNLYMSKWFEQQDILNHPKIRGFITQTGRPSMQEALTHAVPMINFPVLGDQDFNAMRMEETGAGITLEIADVTEEQLQTALSRILYDNSFRTKAQTASQLFKDLPMKPMDTALWWTDYVLRHDDFTHLKPVARHETWYERRMLDVWFTLFLLAFAVLFATLFIFMLILKWSKAYYFSSEYKLKTS